MRVAVTLVLLGFLAARPAHAGEMSSEARGHLEAGLAAYQGKDYARAVAEFSAGYALEPRAEFLFAWGQALRLSGDCAGAIERYQQFVATGPRPEQARAAEELSARCRSTLAEAAPAALPEAAPEVPEASLTDAPPPTTSEPRWWQDPWGGGLCAAGVVGVGVGVAYLVSASGADDDSTSAPTYEAYADARQRVADGHTAAVWSFAAGGALLAAGLTRYVLVSRDTTPYLSHDGEIAVLGLRGRF